MGYLNSLRKSSMNIMVHVDIWNDESLYYGLHTSSLQGRYFARSFVQGRTYKEEARLAVL
jgi:hypothetical protein